MTDDEKAKHLLETNEGLAKAVAEVIKAASEAPPVIKDMDGNVIEDHPFLDIINSSPSEETWDIIMRDWRKLLKGETV